LDWRTIDSEYSETKLLEGDDRAAVNSDNYIQPCRQLDEDSPMTQAAPNHHSIGHAYTAAVRRRFASCLARIKHCLNQLDDPQVWWRPEEQMNSIANIILHLCGNLKQWIISGVGGASDTRNRALEFSERGPIAKADLVRRLDEVIGEVDRVLAGVTDEKLLKIRRIQSFEETILSAILETLSHFNGHTQEIIYITRLQLGDAYRFAWVPATPEQGAPSP
jgi:hypothetical protein